LLKNGPLSGGREDCCGIVVRTANRWPERNKGIRLRTAVDVGYAPETQTKSAAGFIGDGEVAAGWLLSPQFQQNESLAEIRYQWRKNRNLAFDIGIRLRKELEAQALSTGKREETDVLLRLTWGKTIR
jgi:hypothetical protein